MRYAGKQAGTIDSKEYIQIRFKGAFQRAHRLIWVLIYDEDPGEAEVDHKNRIRMDNRAENLRLATRSENLMNRTPNGKWPKGVYLNRSGKFVAQIKLKGKHEYLGLYATPEEAHAAYAKRAKELFKEFACLTR